MRFRFKLDAVFIITPLILNHVYTKRLDRIAATVENSYLIAVEHVLEELASIILRLCF
jgi:hypothetical protein